MIELCKTLQECLTETPGAPGTSLALRPRLSSFWVVWRQRHFLSVHDKLGFKERLATSWLTKCFITLLFP